jgi:glycosyltransferase involved in cell wall biosynthesis
MSEQSSPLVSILIISYNQEDFIEEALVSALEQDYQNLEIIVSDDGSTDSTSYIIKRYAEQYPDKIVPIVDVENLGITGNSNRGLKRCKGKYIAFQGGDDVLLPGKISAQVAWFEQNDNHALCYHDMDVFLSETNETLYYQSERYKFHEGGAEKILTHGAYFGGTTAMIRANRAGQLQFDYRVPIASDWLFWYEAVASCQGIVGYVDGVYARYRRHKHNITNQSDHEIIEAMRTLDIIAQKYPHHRYLANQKRAQYYLIDAYRALGRKDFGKCLSAIQRSIVACDGLWLAPFKLVHTRLQGTKGGYAKVRKLFDFFRFKQSNHTQ